MNSTKRCSVEGCEKAPVSRGWCDMHYGRWKRHGDPLAKKLTGRPNPIEHGFSPSIGYRRFQANGRRELEHRLVAEQMLGRPLAAGEVVHHRNGDRLDNRPENLEVMQRGDHQRLHQTTTHCKHGHPWTPETTRMRVRPNGYPERRCRICERDHSRNARARRRAATLGGDAGHAEP